MLRLTGYDKIMSPAGKLFRPARFVQQDLSGALEYWSIGVTAGCDKIFPSVRLRSSAKSAVKNFYAQVSWREVRSSTAKRQGGRRAFLCKFGVSLANGYFPFPWLFGTLTVTVAGSDRLPAASFAWRVRV
jgi:hypothetical protein